MKVFFLSEGWEIWMWGRFELLLILLKFNFFQILMDFFGCLCCLFGYNEGFL